MCAARCRSNTGPNSSDLCSSLNLQMLFNLWMFAPRAKRRSTAAGLFFIMANSKGEVSSPSGSTDKCGNASNTAVNSRSPFSTARYTNEWPSTMSETFMSERAAKAASKCSRPWQIAHITGGQSASMPPYFSSGNMKLSATRSLMSPLADKTLSAVAVPCTIAHTRHCMAVMNQRRTGAGWGFFWGGWGWFGGPFINAHTPM